MIDLYGLEQSPSTGGIADSRARMVEGLLAKEVSHPRFVPYVQLHEFEALLYADLGALEDVFTQEWEVAFLRSLRSETMHLTPEEIDDGPATSPSKRLIQRIPDYRFQKQSAGPLAAQQIGLARLREACPHFGQWVDRLERPPD